MLNVIKYQMHQVVEDADDATQLEMVELMGRLSNVQALLETGDAGYKPDMLAQLGQHEAWDAAFANRGAPDADAMFGPRCFALEV